MTNACFFSLRIHPFGHIYVCERKCAQLNICELWWRWAERRKEPRLNSFSICHAFVKHGVGMISIARGFWRQQFNLDFLYFGAQEADRDVDRAKTYNTYIQLWMRTSHMPQWWHIFFSHCCGHQSFCRNLICCSLEPISRLLAISQAATFNALNDLNDNSFSSVSLCCGKDVRYPNRIPVAPITLKRDDKNVLAACRLKVDIRHGGAKGTSKAYKKETERKQKTRIAIVAEAETAALCLSIETLLVFR